MPPSTGDLDHAALYNRWKFRARNFQRLEVLAAILALAASGCRTPGPAPAPRAGSGLEAAVASRFAAPAAGAEARPLVQAPVPDAAAGVSVGKLLDLQEPDGCWPSAAPVRTTGLVLLALRYAGVESARLRTAVDRGVLYLVEKQRPDGSWPPGATDDAAIDQALAVWAMAELTMGDSAPGQHETALLRGVSSILDAQAPAGGWGLARRGRPDTLATVLQVAALERAWRAGFSHAGLPDAMARAARYLIGAQNPDGTVGVRGPGLASWTSTAEAALGFDLLGLDARDPRLRALHACAPRTTGGSIRCEYPLLESLLFHIALARQQTPPWEEWVAEIGPELLGRRRDGLWSAPRNEMLFGACYATAAASCILGTRAARQPGVGWSEERPALWAIESGGTTRGFLAAAASIAPWEANAFSPGQVAAMKSCQRLVLATDQWRLQAALERAAGRQALPAWARALALLGDALRPFGATDTLERYAIESLRFAVAEELLAADEVAGLMSRMPEPDQAGLLAVVRATDLNAVARKLHESWRRGDYRDLDDLLRTRLETDASMAHLWQTRLQPLREEVSSRLVKALAGAKAPALIVLDAGWFLGPGSVLDALREAGFAVEEVD
jgi:hypothetical protein